VSHRSTKTEIDRLFKLPPLDEDELDERLAGIDAAEGRRALLERVAMDRIVLEDFQLFADTWDRLDGQQEAPLLNRMAFEARLSPVTRSCAILASGGMEDDNDPGAMADLGVYNMFFLSDPDDEGLDLLIADALSAAPAEALMPLLHRFDRVRTELNFTASECFAELLARPGLADLHDAALAVIGGDCAADAVPELERVRDRCAWSESPLTGELIRQRTRRIDPRGGPPPMLGDAWVGSCDDEGCFSVFARLEKAFGLVQVVAARVEIDGPIQEAFLRDCDVNQTLVEVINDAQLETGCEVIHTHLPLAAQLVVDALEKSGPKNIMSGGVRRALALFERAAERAPGRLQLPDAAPDVTVGVARSLLRRPEFEGWHFLADDPLRMSLDLDPTDKSKRLEQAQILATPERSAALVAMCRHMVRWYLLNGDRQAAAICLTCAAETEADFVKSPLVHAMLQLSAEVLEALRAIEDKPDEDPQFGF